MGKTSHFISICGHFLFGIAKPVLSETLMQIKFVDETLTRISVVKPGADHRHRSATFGRGRDL
jgi:hypothetical protein